MCPLQRWWFLGVLERVEVAGVLAGVELEWCLSQFLEKVEG